MVNKPDGSCKHVLCGCSYDKTTEFHRVFVSMSSRDLPTGGADTNAYLYNNTIARQLRAMSRLSTPLHVACDKGKMPAARALPQHHADPKQIVLDAGRLMPPTVLERARKNRPQEILDLLFKAAI